MDPRYSKSILAFVFLAGSVLAQVESDDTSDATPEWLQEHMQREATRLKPKKVRFGEMRSRLPGEISIEPAYTDGTWHVGTDIGGEYPVVCFIHEQEMNLANTVRAQASFDVDTVSRKLGEALTGRENTTVGAGAIDGAPYLGLQYQYRIGEGDHELIGLIKVWAATRQGATLVCKHNELGYRDSVFRLFEKFVEDFDNSDAPPRPYYGATLVATSDGRPVGVTTVRFRRDDAGYTKIETNRSSLRVGADETVTATDRYDLTWSEASGELINAFSTRTTDGRDEHKVSLTYVDDAWQLSGTVEGQTLDETLDAETRPLTTLGWYRLLRLAMNGEDSEPVSFRTWAPDAAPNSLLNATFSRRGESGGLLDLGAVATEIEVDEDGYIRSATTGTDDDELVLTRVWRAGKID